MIIKVTKLFFIVFFFLCRLGMVMAQPCWIASGAAIGDTSIYAYPVPASITLAHPVSGESLTANTFAGAPVGVHVYMVNEQPMIWSGACAAGTMGTTTDPSIVGNNRYFGVFLVNGTTPTFTAVYYYWGNPFVNAGNEPSLILDGRNNNSINPWVNLGATLNMVPKTLTKTGNSIRGEFVLGMTGGSLPIELLYFTTECTANEFVFNWATASESNNDFFTIEASHDGINWESIANINGAGNSYSVLTYTYAYPADAQLNYFRLKQTDFNGQFSYSQIQFNSCSAQTLPFVQVYPNPGTGNFYVQLNNIPGDVIEIHVTDAIGREIVTQTISDRDDSLPQIVSLNQYNSGMYFFTIRSTEFFQTLPIVVIRE